MTAPILLTSRDQLAARVLAALVGRHGRATKAELCEDTGLSPPSVQRALTRLRALGLELVYSRPRREPGPRRPKRSRKRPPHGTWVLSAPERLSRGACGLRVGLASLSVGGIVSPPAALLLAHVGDRIDRP